MKLRLPGWLATLPLSLAIHVAVVAAAVAFLRTDAPPPALIIDLAAVVVGSADGPSAAGGSATPAASRPAPRPRAAARDRSPAPAPPARSEPAPPRPEAVTPPLREHAPAAAPAQQPEPVPARAAESTPVPSPPTSPFVAAPGTSSTGGGEAAPGRAAGQASVDPGGGPASRSGVGTGEGGGAAAGERVAALPPGSGGGAGAGSGNEYAAYYARLRQRIQETLRYPAAARRRGLAGTVQLEIAIAADGAIAAVSVIGSSSHDLLDRAAVDAARSLPRTPFPADVRAQPLTIRLPVVFELQ